MRNMIVGLTKGKWQVSGAKSRRNRSSFRISRDRTKRIGFIEAA